jgi:hypothetical protein
MPLIITAKPSQCVGAIQSTMPELSFDLESFMFAKKPAPQPPAAQPKPQAPGQTAGWPMLALTAEYGVMGYLAPTEAPLLGFLNMSNQQTVLLTHCQMQALGAQSTASDTMPEAVLPKASLVAFMPRDEAGLRSAGLQLPPQGQRAVIYAGPFIIRASVRLPGEVSLRNLYNTGAGAMFAVAEAEVHCQIPGTRFPDLKAGLLMLNKAHVHFYHPA